MPYCPRCGAEYREGFEICPDCQEPLVDESAFGAAELSVPTLTCENCGEEYPEDAEHCPHCGALSFNAEEDWCIVHGDRVAESVCIICHAPVCSECRTLVGGRTLCPEHSDVELMQDWAMVLKTYDAMKANGAKARLEEEGIPAQIYKLGELFLFAMDGMRNGIAPLGPGTAPLKVFVPVDRYDEAVEILIDTDFLLAE